MKQANGYGTTSPKAIITDAFDVCIIGGGVVGALLARELARYELRLILLDQAEDFPVGASRANSGVLHAGYDPAPGSLKARLNAEGLSLYPALCDELAVDWRRTGTLVVAGGEADIATLGALRDRGRANGVRDLELLSGDAARRLEPNLAPDAAAALYAPSAGIIDPHGLNYAALENAAQNGVDIRRGVVATGFARSVPGDHLTVMTNHGPIAARLAVNAAGLGSGELAAAAGDAIPVRARRGQYLLLDKAAGGLVRRPLFPVPGPAGKGILVLPTIHGNILAGPTAEDVDEPRLTRTTAGGHASVIAAARSLVPAFPSDQVIATFSGVRAVSGDDFVVAPSASVSGLLHLAGICSPGLTAAPAIARLARDRLADMGLALRERRDFDPRRPAKPRLADVSAAERAALVARDPRFGHVICRCETVSEAEIVAAIHAPVGARTVDGVKLRTRAGMGRCQGGFCGSRVAAVIARELGLPIDRVTRHGGGSWLVLERSAIEEVRGSLKEANDDNGVV
ncbi:MAG: NAD(P)/FAD-dependent oxidoreductase [Chloroflexota bacterium]